MSKNPFHALANLKNPFAATSGTSEPDVKTLCTSPLIRHVGE
jgi:hypothetical protein